MDGKINLLFLGRLEKRKGLRYLLGAYSRLKWDWPELRLIVVGPGEPDAESYRLMSERNLQDVIFVGKVSDHERARYFKSAHIYCSPATGKESFGIVLLEAMASGTPVVATDIEGYAGVVSHGDNGLLVPPKKEEELADAIVTLLRDPALRERLAASGSARADEFRWERVASRVIDYYQLCLNERRAVLSH
jgi:phosphatidylinositol alpha-mannosyltransferase